MNLPSNSDDLAISIVVGTILVVLIAKWMLDHLLLVSAVAMVGGGLYFAWERYL